MSDYKATKIGSADIYRVEKKSPLGKAILIIVGGLILLGMISDSNGQSRTTTSAPYSTR